MIGVVCRQRETACPGGCQWSEPHRFLEHPELSAHCNLYSLWRSHTI
jgi:hypothetical protein